MKLLFVSGNLCDGGAQRVIAVVSSQLARMGHEVHILLFARNEKEYPVDPAVQITALGENFQEYSKLSGLQRTLTIRKKVKSIQPDVAVGFLEGGYGLFLATLGMKFPKVASARIDPKFLLQKKGGRAMLDKLWFRCADAVVVQTSRQKEHAKNAGWKNMAVIANPISDNALELENHNYERPCRKIVMAGRLAEQKNYPMALKAMEKVLEKYPDAKLDIFGKGNQEESLKTMILQMGLEGSVQLKGWTQDTLGEYANSDIYVMTSNFEGMPNALMEAMAAGLPCVSTDCDTGPEDLITDGENGYLVPVGDADALANQVVEIMGMTTQKREEIGKKAKVTIAEEFNEKAIAEEWELLLLSL